MPFLTAKERIGTEIGGRYALTSLLGEGGFGAVYRARHNLTGREVALKLLHAHLIQAEQIAQRFLLEAQAMAKIRHPGIVEVLDAGREPDGTIFLALELLEGETLEARVERVGRLPRDEALSIACDVLSALAAAHAHDIVHRDIKPANIFLTRRPDGTAHTKVLDFGIASVAGAAGATRGKLTSAGMILGTPEYMSPEQGRGGAVGPAADLWSVGILLFEMLSGVVPWTAEAATVVLIATANAPLTDIRQFAPELPDALVRAIERALEKEPAKRFASADEMRAALVAVAQTVDAPARPAPEPVPVTAATQVAPATPAPAKSINEDSARRSRFRRDVEMEFEGSASDVPLDLDPSAADVTGNRVSIRPPVRASASAMQAIHPRSADEASPSAGAQPDLDLPLPPGASPPRRPASSPSIAAVRPERHEPVRQSLAPPLRANTAPVAVASGSSSALRVGGGLLVVLALGGGLYLLHDRSPSVAGVARAADDAAPTTQPDAGVTVASAARAAGQLTDRFAVSTPFNVGEDGQRMFARHVVIGPPRVANGLRTIATCIRDHVYLYSSGDGMAVGSIDAPIACDQRDLVLVSDLDGDGHDDPVAVARDHRSLLVMASSSLQVTRSIPLPGATGVAGGLVIASQPSVIAYAEPDGPGAATELVAVAVRTGQVLWRSSGTPPLARLGQPDDLGLAVGSDATGDGIPDVIAGSSILPSLPPDQIPARPRCVELFSGATGSRVWPAPVCFNRGGAQSVALGPDTNADGKGDAIVGSDIVRGTDPRVAILSGVDGRVLRRLAVPEGRPSSGFGWPATLGPDVNGDGAPDVAVGALSTTGTSVTLLSGRDGSALAFQDVAGDASFPSFSLMLTDGVVRGGAPALLIASPEQGIKVVGYMDGHASP